MRVFVLCVCLFVASSAVSYGQTMLAADFRSERDEIKTDCPNANLLLNCFETFTTGSPLHVALGSIAPQNGFGFGPAFVLNLKPGENWTRGASVDAVGALGGAWRAGAYFKFVRTAVSLPTPVGPGAGSPASAGIHPCPVIKTYVQAISLPTVSFFGIRPDSARTGKSIFSMRETIVGANLLFPIPQLGRLNLGLLGELNGRFVAIGSTNSDKGPSIERLYTDASAPSLSTQPGFAQFSEGVGITPSLINGRVRLNYLAKLQQFVASDTKYSFRRWTVDLAHEFPLYQTVASPLTRDINGPNECAASPGSSRCPPMIPPAESRNYTGSVGVRFLVSKSAVSGGSVVPFYFQQTLGGSDVDGNRVLPSYEDYRFRAPHLMLIQESFEHSIGKAPVGVWLAADQGRVAAQEQALNFDHLLHSYTIGLTLRAGGFPAVIASWSTGGSEGNHFAFTISTSLLGGSARPSLQ